MIALPETEDTSGPGDWEILADGRETDCRRRVEAQADGIRVAACSGLLLGKTRAREGAD